MTIREPADRVRHGCSMVPPGGYTWEDYAAAERGLAGYLKGAPLFCAGAVRQALDLPARWQPSFLVLLGYPAGGLALPAPRNLTLDDFLVQR